MLPASLEELLRDTGVVPAGLSSVAVTGRPTRLIPQVGSITLLIVRRGHVRLSHSEAAPRLLAAGDVVVASGGRSFILAEGSVEAARPGPLRDLPLASLTSVATAGPASERPQSEVTVAYYAPERGRRGVSFLPELLVRSGACAAGSGVEVVDADAPDVPRSDLVVGRLLDWLLSCHLAGWLEAQREEDTASQRPVSDAVVRAALRTLRAAPQQPWTVAELAASVGVSRATLTRRFRERLGEAPMQHLAGWRLALAAELLRTSDVVLDSIAHRVGYADGFALSRAFKRRYGLSPSAYRAAYRHPDR